MVCFPYCRREVTCFHTTDPSRLLNKRGDVDHLGLARFKRFFGCVLLIFSHPVKQHPFLPFSHTKWFTIEESFSHYLQFLYAQISKMVKACHLSHNKKYRCLVASERKTWILLESYFRNAIKSTGKVDGFFVHVWIVSPTANPLSRLEQYTSV